MNMNMVNLSYIPVSKTNFSWLVHLTIDGKGLTVKVLKYLTKVDHNRDPHHLET